MKNKNESLINQIVLYFFQGNGKSLRERVGVLNKALSVVGIKATYHQDENGKAWFNGDNETELKKAESFKNDLQECYPRGKFEWEFNAVQQVIEDYTK